MTLEERFASLILNDIDDYITNKQEENLELEFKTINSSSLEKDDKTNLAKALSGFANSSGGLVKTGKNKDKFDYAVGKQEIDNLPLFLSRLNALTGEAVNPLVDEVKHRGIFSNGDNGFAVTIVPESETAPHMAKCGENKYYKRSGDSFYQMEHFDLEDMFGRRKKPKLYPLLETVFSSGHDGTQYHQVLLKLCNMGRGIAKAPNLYFEIRSQMNPSFVRFYEGGLDRKGNLGLPQGIRFAPRRKEYDSEVKYFAGTPNDVIYASSTRDIALLQFDIHEGMGGWNLPVPVTFICEVGAEDMRQEKGIIRLESITSDFRLRFSSFEHTIDTP
jgi:Putative DNA-binding domain